MNLSRATLLVLVTGFLAVLTSFMPLIPRGLMAAALAVSLSLGTIWMSWKHERTRKAPERGEIVLIGLLSGLAGGTLAACTQFVLPAPSHEFLPPPTPAWNLLPSGALYGVVLHLSCRREPLAHALLSSVLGCFVVRLLSGIAIGLEPLAVAFLALFGAVPFGILWTLATVKLTRAGKNPPSPVASSNSVLDRAVVDRGTRT